MSKAIFQLQLSSRQRPYIAFSFLVRRCTWKVRPSTWTFWCQHGLLLSDCGLLSAPAVSDQFMCLTFQIPLRISGCAVTLSSTEHEHANQAEIGIFELLQVSGFISCLALTNVPHDFSWSDAARGRCALQLGQFRCQHGSAAHLCCVVFSSCFQGPCLSLLSGKWGLTKSTSSRLGNPLVQACL